MYFGLFHLFLPNFHQIVWNNVLFDPSVSGQLFVSCTLLYFIHSCLLTTITNQDQSSTQTHTHAHKHTHTPGLSVHCPMGSHVLPLMRGARFTLPYCNAAWVLLWWTARPFALLGGIGHTEWHNLISHGLLFQQCICASSSLPAS